MHLDNFKYISDMDHVVASSGLVSVLLTDCKATQHSGYSKLNGAICKEVDQPQQRGWWTKHCETAIVSLSGCSKDKCEMQITDSPHLPTLNACITSMINLVRGIQLAFQSQPYSQSKAANCAQ